jgi:hypothetical protein
VQCEQILKVLPGCLLFGFGVESCPRLLLHDDLDKKFEKAGKSLLVLRDLRARLAGLTLEHLIYKLLYLLVFAFK